MGRCRITYTEIGVRNMRIVLTDNKEICWKFIITEDMRLDELLIGIEKQFYNKKKQEDEE